MTSGLLATTDENTRTLVLICRRDLCRVFDHVLLIQGFTRVSIATGWI